MQCLLVQSLISSSCLTLLLWVDQRLRELCLRTPAGGNISAAARKMSYFAVICWQSAIWRGGSSGNQSRVQCGKIGGIARIVGEIKRQEVKSRNLASRVHFLPFCPIEISHCGQTKHRWQQHRKYRNTKNIARYFKTYMSSKYLKSILRPFQGQGWAMSILL